MGKESRIGPEATQVGQTLRVVCIRCDRETIHKVITSAEYESHYSEPGFSVDSWDQYQIIECQGCESISFCHANQNTEDLDSDPETGEMRLADTVKLFPPRHRGRVDLEDWHILPVKVRRIYQETLTALRSDLPILTGIGLRAIVEMICNDRGAKGKNLRTQIDDLVTQQVLTPDGATILHDLRVLGNAAAHEVRPHSLEQLNVAFDVVEYVLKGTYILPERAKYLTP